MSWVPSGSLAMSNSTSSRPDKLTRLRIRRSYPEPAVSAIRDHVAGLEARWTFLGAPGEGGALTALASYEVSFLTYEALETDAIVAPAPSLGVSVLYSLGGRKVGRLSQALRRAPPPRARRRAPTGHQG
jgi:hypothetical protein